MKLDSLITENACFYNSQNVHQTFKINCFYIDFTGECGEHDKKSQAMNKKKHKQFSDDEDATELSCIAITI